MIRYIKINLTPLLIGICIALMFNKVADTINDVIVKREIINGDYK